MAPNTRTLLKRRHFLKVLHHHSSDSHEHKLYFQTWSRHHNTNFNWKFWSDSISCEWNTLYCVQDTIRWPRGSTHCASLLTLSRGPTHVQSLQLPQSRVILSPHNSWICPHLIHGKGRCKRWAIINQQSDTWEPIVTAVVVNCKTKTTVSSQNTKYLFCQR